MLRGSAGHLLPEQVHDRGCEDVDAEQAEVVAGPQPRHLQGLLRLAGGRLLDDILDLVKVISEGDSPPADGPVVGEHVLAGRLHGGDGAALRLRLLDDLLRTTLGPAADVEVVADEVEERLVAGEGVGQPEGMAIAAGLFLFEEDEPAGVLAGGLGIGALIARADDQGDLVGAGLDDLLKDDPESLLLGSVAVDQRLQRQSPLVPRSCRDDGSVDVHGHLPEPLVIAEAQGVA